MNSRMKPDDWIRDAVFQKNLLLWMAKEQPPERFSVRPLFAERGYAIFYVEQPFPFPAETRNAIDAVAEKKKIEISRNPKPELILRHTADRHALYFEAKANSFGSDRSEARQARGHLVATGPAFAEVFKPLERATLTYVLPESARDGMRGCLETLSAELGEAGLQVGIYSVAGLSVADGDLSYHMDEIGRRTLGLPDPEAVVMTGIADDTDPSPLLLVFSAQDCPDGERTGYYRRVLQNQAIVHLLCELHRASVATPFSLSTTEILEHTTQGVFEFVGREGQREMESLIRENIFRRILDYWKDRVPGLVRVDGKVLRMDFQSDSRKDLFLDWLESKKTGFDDAMPKTGEKQQGELPGLENP